MKTVSNMKGALALTLAGVALASAASNALGGGYKFQVVASGLHRPTGIAVKGSDTIYFTEVPTPGLPGPQGGSNAVSRLTFPDCAITTLHAGEPEPVNITIGRRNELYWTCKSAGVILEQDRHGETSVFLSGLDKPSGISVDRHGNVYFTLLPTPGVNDMNGGSNSVAVSDGTTTAILHLGEPEPSDIVVARDGDLYWTCKSAGVILKQDADGNTSVLLSRLDKPVGIALDHRDRMLYWTEVPTPGVGGADGGQNRIWELDLKTGEVDLVHEGDPEPTDIAVARNGNLYWTCTSAGVIVEARPRRRH